MACNVVRQISLLIRELFGVLFLTPLHLHSNVPIVRTVLTHVLFLRVQKLNAFNSFCILFHLIFLLFFFQGTIKIANFTFLTTLTKSNMQM